MRRMRTLAAWLLVLGTVHAPATVSADTITLTDGALFGTRPQGMAEIAGMDASGERGLTIKVGLDTVSVGSPIAQCIGDVCPPGVSFSLEAGWGGSDISGTVSIDGQTFPLGQSEDTAQLVFSVTGPDIVLPPFQGNRFESFSAPFSFTGGLTHPVNGLQVSDDLVGRGLATFVFEWTRDEAVPVNSWLPRSYRYEFASAAPVPEPATLTLLGIGLTGVAARGWRKRRG